MRRDLIALAENSKVWIYQANKEIDYDTSSLIKEELYSFTMQWASHGQELECYANLFHYRFLVFVADDSNLPSGCSIDSSVHFINQLGDKYEVNFFDRLQFAYIENDNIRTISQTEIKPAYHQNKLNDQTMMFDNLVKTKAQFLERWIIPLEESWHKRFV